MNKLASTSVLLKKQKLSTTSLRATRARSTPQTNSTVSSFKATVKSSSALRPNTPSIANKTQKIRTKASPSSTFASTHLIKLLKSSISPPSKELSLIQKAIPKFTARKVQDLKKGFKSTEHFNALAACFLNIFAQFDEELGNDLVSLRKKVGETFTSYLSNSGKFINAIRSLPESLKSNKLTGKSMITSTKFLSMTRKDQLSSNYQDLYDLLHLILEYCKKAKSRQPLLDLSKSQNLDPICFTEPSNDIKDIFSSHAQFTTFNSSSYELNTYDFLSNTQALKSIRQPSLHSTAVSKITETARSSSQRLILNKPCTNQRLNSSAAGLKQKDVKENLSSSRKKQWEELRAEKKTEKIKRQTEIIKQINLEKRENEVFSKLQKERERKEKEEIIKFRREELEERRRIKKMGMIKDREAIQDEINRNLRRSMCK